MTAGNLPIDFEKRDAVEFNSYQNIVLQKWKI